MLSVSAICSGVLLDDKQWQNLTPCARHHTSPGNLFHSATPHTRQKRSGTSGAQKCLCAGPTQAPRCSFLTACQHPCQHASHTHAARPVPSASGPPPHVIQLHVNGIPARGLVVRPFAKPCSSLKENPKGQYQARLGAGFQPDTAHDPCHIAHMAAHIQSMQSTSQRHTNTVAGTSSCIVMNMRASTEKYIAHAHASTQRPIMLRSGARDNCST